MSAGAGPSNAPPASGSGGQPKGSTQNEWLHKMQSLVASLSENELGSPCRGPEEDDDLQLVSDEKLALTLQLHVMVEDRKASKASKASDFSAAVDCQAKFLSSAIAQFDDALLCRSVDRAVAADSETILAVLHENERELKDRRLALSLAGRHVDENNYDSDGIEMRPPRKQDCSVCFDQCYPVVVTKCKHTLCRSCVHELYSRAMLDEELVPARCCNNTFDANVARAVLNAMKFQEYCARVEELGATNPLYCPAAHCSRFLGGKSEAHERKDIDCPGCHSTLCNVCGSAQHTGQCIPDPVAEDVVKEWAEDKQVQQCEKCRRFIELEMGCNHMTCRCGHQFCFQCGAKWRSCGCDMWEESNLTRRADAVALIQHVPVNVVRNRLEENNRGNEECVDHQMRNHSGEAVCDDCNYNMPVYFYRCDGCYETRCRRCLLFRGRGA